MYAVRWFDTTEYEVVGDRAAILYVAYMLERRQVNYKVSDVGVGALSQDQFGKSGMEYWLEPETRFSR